MGTIGTRQTEHGRDAALHNTEYNRRMIAREARRQELVRGKGLKKEFDLSR